MSTTGRCRARRWQSPGTAGWPASARSARRGSAARTCPASDDTLYCLFSSTKGIVASAVWALLEEGLLRTEERVAEIIPEFGTNGKDVVTVEQVLLHIAGFPLAPMRATDWDDRERRLANFARWRLTFEPGTQYIYHATSAHWVLAEIIERRTGQDFRRYLRQRILDPLGLDDLYVGLPHELTGRVADVYHVVPPEPPPGGWGEVTPEAILSFNTPEVRRVGVPGGGGIGNAAMLALYYGALVNGGESPLGGRVLKPETIEMATTVRTQPFHRDPMFGHAVNRALAVVVHGDDAEANLRGFGNTASARAFGHGGAGGQIAWGDPETGISLGYCTHGFVDMVTTGRRTQAIGSLAGLCAI